MGLWDWPGVEGFTGITNKVVSEERVQVLMSLRCYALLTCQQIPFSD
jgi:hypothetical protein